MKRLATPILAGLLLVGLVAQPALAERTPDTGNFPHYSRVFFPGAAFGQSEVVQVPTGEWVRLTDGWGTATVEQLEQFLATVIVEVELDGVPQPVTPVVNRDPEGPSVSFPYLLNPSAANVAQEWRMRWTFTEDHDDGYGAVIPAGTVFDDSRTIVWTPRGRFPSAAYPCPNGAYPCVDF